MSRDDTIQFLRGELKKFSPQSGDELYQIGARIRDAKEVVISRYAPMFAPANLDKLTPESFCSFLLFRNNQHWDSLHRQGGMMTADMPRLREALGILGDESAPIRSRLDSIRPAWNEPMVKGLGRAVMTGILQVLYPDRYGVWNNISQKSMTKLGLWPEMPRGTSFGTRYEILNKDLLSLARDVGTDLWTLDMLWWRVVPHVPKGAS